MKPSALSELLFPFPPALNDGLAQSRRAPVLFKSHTFLQRLHLHYLRTSASTWFTSSLPEKQWSLLYHLALIHIPAMEMMLAWKSSLRNGSGLLSVDSQGFCCSMELLKLRVSNFMLAY